MIAARFWLCFALLGLASWQLIGSAWIIADDNLLIMLAVPISQCSLAAVWACTSDSWFPLRFAVPFVAIVLGWFMLSRILPWGTGDPASAAWAFALIIQTLLIVFVFAVIGNGLGLVDDAKVRSRLRFRLQTLILWTTAVACGLCFLQYGRLNWGWNLHQASLRYRVEVPSIAVCNALIALMTCWGFTRKSIPRKLMGVVAAFAMTLILAYMLAVTMDRFGASTFASTALQTFCGSQFALILGALAVVGYPHYWSSSRAQKTR